MNPEDHPLADGYPPDWAVEWGEDRRSPFASFAVEGVLYRLRWMQPGRFWMGSPEGEAGRYDSEGPRHEVTLTRGFWLGETPVTQALWEGVMGNNPSRFQSPDRPVEQVSWEDTHKFCRRLADRVPGLRLPTEAEWEYACRAGTTGATWAGDLEILGENNAPLLDPIAWYGGNSGVGFELDNGYDSSEWPNRQHDHRRAGTHPVGKKAANPWGLRDMLGNVWEWCEDGWSDRYPGGPRTDPLVATGARRVFRGGSWDDHARFVRAAYRRGISPDGRNDNLGFRLARGPSAK